MATATKQTMPPPPPAEIVKSITLVLTPAEANTLAVLCSRISGDRSGSPRKHTNNVLYALEKVGVRYSASTEHTLVDNSRPSRIAFKDYPKKGDGYPF